MSIKELLIKILKLQSYYITTVDWKSPQYTIAAGSTLTVENYDVSSVIPAGYDIVASIPLGSGSNQCYVYWCNSTSDKKITYQIKNALMSQISGYIWVRFILRKKSGGYKRKVFFRLFKKEVE